MRHSMDPRENSKQTVLLQTVSKAMLNRDAVKEGTLTVYSRKHQVDYQSNKQDIESSFADEGHVGFED